MSVDCMRVRLHLRLIRVLAVLVDTVDELVVEVTSTRSWSRCPDCGFRCPAAVTAVRLVPSLPGRTLRAGLSAIGSLNCAREPILHVLTQSVVRHELRRLRALGDQLGLPLRDRRPVLELPASRGGVASKLPRDRRRRPVDPASDRPHAHALRVQDRDLLALMKRQVAAFERSEIHRWHSATMSEPSTSNSLRHADRSRGLLARHSSRDHTPELPLDLATKRRRSRRLHRRPTGQLLHPPCWPAHQQPPHRGVATTS